MLTEQRYEIILGLLREKNSVTVTELKDILNASESTVRRDITALYKAGKLTRVFGGAVALEHTVNAYEPTVAQKSELNIEEKKKIAAYAASLIQPEDFVYLDAGTTTELMIDYLTTKQTVFVTNAVAHARKLSQAGYTTFILGGELKATTEAIIGPEAVESLRKYNFTKGFWGANGVHRKNGFTTPDPKEAKVKQTAMEHCVKRYVLSDASKFSQISCVKFADFANACIITTKVSDPVYAECDNIIEVQGGEAK